MNLDERLSRLKDKKKKFVILRVAGFKLEDALAQAGAKKSAYNRWTRDPVFHDVYKDLGIMQAENKEDAIKALRKENQLAAALLEGEIIVKLREEIQSGELSLAKTNLGREVYNKLMAELDKPPKSVTLTWEEMLIGEIEDNGNKNYTITESSKIEEHKESQLQQIELQGSTQGVQEDKHTRSEVPQEES